MYEHAVQPRHGLGHTQAVGKGKGRGQGGGELGSAVNKGGWMDGWDPVRCRQVHRQGCAELVDNNQWRPGAVRHNRQAMGWRGRARAAPQAGRQAGRVPWQPRGSKTISPGGGGVNVWNQEFKLCTYKNLLAQRQFSTKGLVWACCCSGLSVMATTREGPLAPRGGAGLSGAAAAAPLANYRRGTAVRTACDCASATATMASTRPALSVALRLRWLPRCTMSAVACMRV